MNKKIIGSIFWISTVQYFIVQVIVAAAYDCQFSLAHNTISDLGNTARAVYGDRFVCSPLHDMMNASFIILGITQMLGALLLHRAIKKTSRSTIGFSFMVLAGLGTILVGLYPENTAGPLHAIGAALPFLLGNIAMLLLARLQGLPKWLSYYSYFSGLLGLIALSLFMTTQYLGLGQGGMERIVAYPQTIWMIVVGAYFIITVLQTLNPMDDLQQKTPS